MFLIGNYRNFEELEESLSLPEIKLILETSGKKKRQDQIFAAQIQGIDIEGESQKAKIKEIQDRANATLAGGEEKLEAMSLADLGMFVESE